MNGGMGDLAAIISSGDPNQVLERAAGLQVVGALRQQTLANASNTKVIAGLLQQKAAVALARQQAAAAAAAAAKAAAEAQANAAAAQQKAVAAEQTKLVAQLAHLQRISIALAKQRQAGIAKAGPRRRPGRPGWPPSARPPTAAAVAVAAVAVAAVRRTARPPVGGSPSPTPAPSSASGTSGPRPARPGSTAPA